MTTVTIEHVKAEHDRLGQLIATLQASAKKTLVVPEARIELQSGERYAGLILSPGGVPAYHLILLSGEAEGIEWADAQEWAVKAGGTQPTRREQSLLYANLKDAFKPEWYWSSETHETNGSFAWYQGFLSGHQGNLHKSAEGRAVAVRRVSV